MIDIEQFSNYQNFLHFKIRFVIFFLAIFFKNGSIITKSLLLPFHFTFIKKYNSYKLSRSHLEKQVSRYFSILLSTRIESNPRIRSNYLLVTICQKIDSTSITFLIDRIELVKLVEPRSRRVKFRHVHFAKEIYSNEHETKRNAFNSSSRHHEGSGEFVKTPVTGSVSVYYYRRGGQASNARTFHSTFFRGSRFPPPLPVTRNQRRRQWNRNCKLRQPGIRLSLT